MPISVKTRLRKMRHRRQIAYELEDALWVYYRGFRRDANVMLIQIIRREIRDEEEPNGQGQPPPPYNEQEEIEGTDEESEGRYDAQF